MDQNAKSDAGEEMDDRARLAERLRQAREYLGFSQDQVAQYLGVPRTALSNMETGQRRVEAVELKRLAALYKKSLAYFTGEPTSTVEVLPPDVEHLARKASQLTTQDREELARFADFLGSRARNTPGKAPEGH
jgi:transcriptional regulator with XRE-family HTH domain